MTPLADTPDDVAATSLLEGEGFRATGEALLERAKQLAHTTEGRVETLLTAARGRPVRGQAPTVLVVDGEPDIRECMALVLQRAGYRVLAAGDRAGAVACCTGPEPVSLLVCDVLLPHDDGGQVAEAVLAVQPGMRVLFVSGLLYPDAVGRGLVPAGCEYLPKPFSLLALRARVAELLRGPLAAAG
jgi:CheY-like chemotaxis protein